MLLHKPPAPLPERPALFLAGSIDQGSADDWQSRLAHELRDVDGDALNPRRDGWDATWRQRIDEPQFRAQVEWELDGLDRSRVVAMYFAPSSQAPITLLELGLVAARTPHKLVVCCPDGYWRKGNVEIVCARFGVTLAHEWSVFVTTLRARLRM
jgi:hypothetical protein